MSTNAKAVVRLTLIFLRPRSLYSLLRLRVAFKRLEVLTDKPLEKRTCAAFCSPVRRVQCIDKVVFWKMCFTSERTPIQKMSICSSRRKEIPHSSPKSPALWRGRFGKLQDEQRKTKIKTHRDGAQSKIPQNATARTCNHNTDGHDDAGASYG